MAMHYVKMYSYRPKREINRGVQSIRPPLTPRHQFQMKKRIFTINRRPREDVFHDVVVLKPREDADLLIDSFLVVLAVGDLLDDVDLLVNRVARGKDEPLPSLADHFPWHQNACVHTRAERSIESSGALAQLDSKIRRCLD